MQAKGGDMTKLKRIHLDGYHGTAIEKMRTAQNIGDDAQYAYWYGVAVGVETSLWIGGELTICELFQRTRTEAGFGEDQCPAREI